MNSTAGTKAAAAFVIIIGLLFASGTTGRSQIPKETNRTTGSDEARLATAVSLHAEGLRHQAAGQSEAGFLCFAEAYKVRREILGLLNTNTEASLKPLALGQSSRASPESEMGLLAQLEIATTNLFKDHDLTNRLIAICERRITIYDRLGKKVESRAAQKQLLLLSGLSEEQIDRQDQATKAIEAQAEKTRIEAEKWSTQMRANLFPRLAAGVNSNLAGLASMDTNSPQFRQQQQLEGKYRQKGYSEQEIKMTQDQTEAMHNLLDALAGRLKNRSPGISNGTPNVPNSEADLLNLFRTAAGEVATNYPKLLSTIRKTNDSRASTLELEKWFESEWQKWNGDFERGTSLNRLVGQKQYSDPLLMIPGNAQETGRSMGLLALNLKGLLLDREFRLQAALARSADPAVAGWREKLWSLQLQSLRSRPQPIDPAEQGFAPRDVLRNSPFTIVENKKFEAEQKDLRLLALALPGAARRSIVSVEQVRERLPAHSALVEFMRYGRNLGGLNLIEERFGAVVMTKENESAWVDLGASTNISPLVTEYLEMMRRDPAAPPAPEQAKGLLARLYETVWLPLEAALSGDVHTVFIAPDGELNLLSFATLLRKERFLAETHTFVYLLGGRDLLETNSPSRGRRLVDIWADADYDRQQMIAGSVEVKNTNQSAAIPPFRNYGAAKLHRLPGTLREALDLKELAEKQHGYSARLHLGKNATEAGLRAVEHPYILHLGTHGVFIPLQNAKALQPWLTGGLRNQFNGDAALFQSAIGLAGANRTFDAWLKEELPTPEDDGILVASEAAQLNLEGTWLVTLSACDTGTGGIANGESLLGIKLGFLQAGARNVCVGLWLVSDEYSPLFFRPFYANALQNGDAPLALAKVQRAELMRLSASGTRDALWNAARLAGPFMLTTRGL